MDESAKNWSIFLVVVSVLIVGMYYIFRNSPIGQLFSDLFGFLSSGAAAADEKLKQCEDSGFFSTTCGVGIGLIVAAIMLAFFGAVKWLLGPAGDTKMGELWRSITGNGVTSSDLSMLKNNVEIKVKSFSEDPKTRDKWDNLSEEGQQLFREISAAYETHSILSSKLSNSPTDQQKLRQLTSERDLKVSQAQQRYEDNQDPADPYDGEDILNDVQSLYGE